MRAYIFRHFKRKKQQEVNEEGISEEELHFSIHDPLTFIVIS